jgi:hypothetical protein
VDSSWLYSKIHIFPYLEYAETDFLSTRLLEKSSTDNGTIVLEPGYGVRSPQNLSSKLVDCSHMYNSDLYHHILSPVGNGHLT